VQGYIFSAPKPAAELKRRYFADHVPQTGPSLAPHDASDLVIFPASEGEPPESAPRAATA
jgi:hypothetical protein